MAQTRRSWPNGGAMRYYLCPDCLHVTESHSHGAFDWCTCGQPLDAVSLLTESVPLAEHPSVPRLDRKGRFARLGDGRTVATSEAESVAARSNPNGSALPARGPMTGPSWCA